MPTSRFSTVAGLFGPRILIVALAIFWPGGLVTGSARTITFSLELTRYQYSGFNPYYQGNTYYTAAPSLTSDSPPVTYDEADSPIPAYSASENGSGVSYFFDL